MLELIEFNGLIDEFMKTDEFKEKIANPAKQYYNDVYNLVTKDLSDRQKVIFDDWWNGVKRIPSDDCYWKGTNVPEGYEQYTPLDIKIVHDSVLSAVSLGCG